MNFMMKKFSRCGLLALLSFMVLSMASVTAQGAVSDATFLDLCESGTVQDVRRAIRNGANVNAKDKDGRTPLMSSEVLRDPEKLRVLLNAKANVNAKDKNGQTALMEAISHSYLASEANPEVIEALLDAGANVNAKDKDGRTALMQLGPIGPMEMIVRLLLSAGADVNAKDKNGRTALMNEDLSLDGMRLLIRAGADVNAKDKNGETPLIRAVKGGWTVKAVGNGIGGYPEEVKLLLDAGADVNAVDKKGHDALWYAQDNYRRAAKLKETLFKGEYDRDMYDMLKDEYNMLWNARNNDQIVAMLKKRKGSLGARQSTPKQTSKPQTRPAGRR